MKERDGVYFTYFETSHPSIGILADTIVHT